MVRKIKQHSFQKSLIHSCVAFSICQYPAYAQAQEEITQQEKVFSIIQRIKSRYAHLEQAGDKPDSPLKVASVTRASVNEASAQSSEFTSTATPQQRLNDDSQKNDSVASETIYADDTETSDNSRFIEGEELLVTLYVKDIKISEVFIIKSKSGFVIDLISLMQQLDFYVDITGTGQQLKGWFIKDDNKFDINLPLQQGDVTSSVVRGKTYPLTVNDYQILDDIVYVELAVLQSWFDFTFALEETDLKLVLTSPTPLPIELKKQREMSRVANTKAETAVLPFRDEGYKAFSVPLFDAQVNQQFSKSGKSNNSATAYSLVGSGDLSYFTSQFYLTGNKDEALGDATLSLLRESNKNDLGGPLKLSSFEFGDIVPVNSGRGATQGLSVGIRASSLSSTETGDNQTVNLVGEIQDGWDLELYRNGVLLDKINGTSGGRYEFNDVALVFGDNTFEIVFYGPQGQVETRQEKYSITGNSLASGDSSYSVSLSKQNTKLFDIAENSNQEKGHLFSSVYRYGFTDWWSGRLGLSYLQPEQGDEKAVAGLGQSFVLGKVLLGVDYETDKQKNDTISGNARTQFFDTSWSLGYQQNRNTSAVNSTDLSTDRRYDIAMAGVIPFSIPVSYQNDYSVYESENGSQLTRFGNGISIRTDLGYFSNSIQSLHAKSVDTIVTNYGLHQPERDITQPQQELLEAVSYTTNRAINGSLRYTTNFGRVFAGVSANYTVKPEYEIDSLVSNFSYRLSQSISSTLALNYNFERSQLGGRIGLSWQGDSLSVDSYFNYSRKDSYSAGLNARFSFGYENNTGQLFADKRSLTSGGVMAVRVFEDKNLNQQYDKGEPLVENATVRAAQSYRSAETNEHGVAILSALQPGYVTDIVVDRSSFEDPFMIPSSQGISVKPRRGYLSTYDLPVSSTGEIEGKVYITEKDGQNVPAAYANLSLVNAAGEEVTTSITEFDGYYVFSDVLPGQYKIYLDPSYAKRKKLRKATSMQVNVAGSGELFNAADVTLAQLEFKDGYAADLGSFTSLPILKAYWALIRKTGMNTAKFRPFYALNEESKYELKAVFYPDKKKVEEVCARFNAREISCEVKTQGFDL